MGEHYIGIDIGGTTAKRVRLEAPGTVRDRARVETHGRAAGELIDALVAAARPWLDDRRAPARALGVAVPGLVDRAAGSVLPGCNLQQLDGFPIVAALRDATGLPVELDNDANAAGLAEALLGAARGADSVVCLTVGWGVGGAIVVGGRLWRGHSGMAGELGRLRLGEDGSRTLEADIGAAAVVAAYRERGGRVAGDTDARQVAARADEGDEAAREALARCGRRLGVGLAILVNLLNPERIVVGGGIVGAGEWFLGPARRECGRRARGAAWDRCELVVSKLGAEAGAIGAALLCCEEPRGHNWPRDHP
jgi:glucokinase